MCNEYVVDEYGTGYFLNPGVSNGYCEMCQDCKQAGCKVNQPAAVSWCSSFVSKYVS